MKRALLALALVTLPTLALAQDRPEGDPHAGVPGAPPVDPHAGVPGAPPVDPHGGVPGVDPHGGAPDPHAGVPGAPPGVDPHAGGAGGAHGGMDVASLFRPPDVVRAAEAPELPVGTIRVEVEDELGNPVNAAEVELGTMASGRAAARRPASTGPDGVATYSDLVSGSGTAYRVYVNHEGARYSSQPIVLPVAHGYVVRVRRLPVSHDDRQLLQFVAQSIVEIRDGRLHVVIQAQLVNVGRDTYVFPEGGTQMRLPEGFIAFNAPPALNEIEIVEVAGHGIAFHGSLPPGLITTAFSYDVPYSSGLGLESLGIGEAPRIEVVMGNPFRTMRYRIIVDAPEGLSVDAPGFPAARRFEDDGRALLGSELMRRPGEPPLEEIRFTLRGLPGPGPMRWIAVALGLVLAALGVWRALRPSDEDTDRRVMLEALGRREGELLAEAARLREERDAGELGPESCQLQLDQIVQELANVLRRRDKLMAGRADGAGGPPRNVRRAEADTVREPGRPARTAAKAAKAKTGKPKRSPEAPKAPD